MLAFFSQPILLLLNHKIYEAKDHPFYHLSDCRCIDNVSCVRPLSKLLFASSFCTTEFKISITYLGPLFDDFIHNDPHEFVMPKMAFFNLLPADEPELYNYYILLDHLRLPSAHHNALSCPLSLVKSLRVSVCQLHQLALKEIQTILTLPDVACGDAEGFQNFAVRVWSLVGLLQTLNSREGAAELACASHVQHLLSNLPIELVTNFARHVFSASPVKQCQTVKQS